MSDWHNRLGRDEFSDEMLARCREALEEFGSNGFDASTCLGFVRAIEDVRTSLTAKDAEIERLQELVREALARCEGIARAHDLGTPEGARIADGIASLARSLAPDPAEAMRKRVADDWFGPGQLDERPDHASDPAEDMRAKCEAIVRSLDDGTGNSADHRVREIALAIAALKGRGDWK